jgi:hypothetical protein
VFDNTSAAKNRPKLDKIAEHLHGDQYKEMFSFVGVCSSGLRLIVRTDRLIAERLQAAAVMDGGAAYSGSGKSSKSTGGDSEGQVDGPIEAYVFIHWARNRGQHVHHAVVQSENDWMRGAVAAAIRSSGGEGVVGM